MYNNRNLFTGELNCKWGNIRILVFIPNLSANTSTRHSHNYSQNTDLGEGVIVEHFKSIDLFIVTDSVSIVNVQPYLVTI